MGFNLNFSFYATWCDKANEDFFFSTSLQHFWSIHKTQHLVTDKKNLSTTGAFD